MSSHSSTPSMVPSSSVSYAAESFISSFSSFSTIFSSQTSTAPSTTATLPTSSSSTASLTDYESSSTTTSISSAVSSTSSTSASLAVDQPSSSVTSATLTTGAGALSSATVSNALVLTSGSATPSSATTHSSSSDFFSSKGAVAGTFTVVGLVGVALVIAIVMFIIKRRAKTYEEDAEFLDKNPDLFSHPPTNRVTSIDDISSSDHTHYGAPPMALAPPPVSYPDLAVTHLQALQAESFPQPPSHGYPAGYGQEHSAQYIYTPEDYDIGYPPVASYGNLSPYGSASVQVEPTPAPRAHATLSDALNTSTKPTLTVPAQRADSRFSVDSFYTGIARDPTTSTGQAF